MRLSRRPVIRHAFTEKLAGQIRSSWRGDYGIQSCFHWWLLRVLRVAGQWQPDLVFALLLFHRSDPVQCQLITLADYWCWHCWVPARVGTVLLIFLKCQLNSPCTHIFHCSHSSKIDWTASACHCDFNSPENSVCNNWFRRSSSHGRKIAPVHVVGNHEAFDSAPLLNKPESTQHPIRAVLSVPRQSGVPLRLELTVRMVEFDSADLLIQRVHRLLLIKSTVYCFFVHHSSIHSRWCPTCAASSLRSQSQFVCWFPLSCSVVC